MDTIRIGSASGWLSVTVLMQADGRYELARKMLKRSADEGLEPDVRSALDAALGAAGWGLRELRRLETPLEQTFLVLTAGDEAA
jgi:hypothetical protein